MRPPGQALAVEVAEPGDSSISDIAFRLQQVVGSVSVHVQDQSLPGQSPGTVPPEIRAGPPGPGSRAAAGVLEPTVEAGNVRIPIPVQIADGDAAVMGRILFAINDDVLFPLRGVERIGR